MSTVTLAPSSTPLKGAEEHDFKLANAKPLTGVLLPESTIRSIAQLKRSQISGISRLVLHITAEALEAYIKGKWIDLDPLVGDFGCELHTIKNLRLCMSTTLRAEVNALSIKVKPLLTELGTLCTSSKSQRPGQEPNVLGFFNDKVGGVLISDKMAHLLRVRLLTITKKDLGETEETRCELLGRLAGNVSADTHKELVEDAQGLVCRASRAHVQEESTQFKALPKDELALLQKMLGVHRPVCTHYVKPNRTKRFGEGNAVVLIPQHHQKLIGLFFYQIKALMTVLKETQTLIAVKKMVTKGEETFALYYRANPLGKFEAVRDEEYGKMQPNTPMVVLEGHVASDLTREQFAQKVDKIGIENLMLANASQGPQIGYKDGVETTLDDVPDAAARAEIERFQKLAQEHACEKGKNPFFMVDHAYLNTVGFA